MSYTHKPFLTVDTGEAYQLIRLRFGGQHAVLQTEELAKFKCLTANDANSWSWWWCGEVSDLPFASVDDADNLRTDSIRLGSILIINDSLVYINLQSFKRACLAIPFFRAIFEPMGIRLESADFINKLYAEDEVVAESIAELCSDEELDMLLAEQMLKYHKLQDQCEHAVDIDEALAIVQQYADAEINSGTLNFCERYLFDDSDSDDPSLTLLSFYIFIRSRELVATKRWLGETDYTLNDAVAATVETVLSEANTD